MESYTVITKHANSSSGHQKDLAIQRPTVWAYTRYPEYTWRTCTRPCAQRGPAPIATEKNMREKREKGTERERDRERERERERERK